MASDIKRPFESYMAKNWITSYDLDYGLFAKERCGQTEKLPNDSDDDDEVRSSGGGSLGGGSFGGGYDASSAYQSFAGGYGLGSAQISSQGSSCAQPKSPMNGAHHCSMANGQWSCQGTCNPGYEFPDRSRQLSITCNDRDGKWLPVANFEDCRALCHPPCENGGECSVLNQCVCPLTHRGNRCQYAISLCDFHRFSTSSSVQSDCKHTGEYTECHVSCPPGMTFHPPTTSLYRCTVNGLWNPPTAPQCRDNLCKQLPSPMNGRIACEGSNEIMICKGSCRSGYIFPDGFSELSTQCVRRTGEWTPYVSFPDCEPICNPGCENGGKCLGHNSCLCPRGFRGERCQYPTSNCDAHDRFASVAWNCKNGPTESVCNISCGHTGSKLQPAQPTVYTCSLDGTWQPDLKPICVTDYSLLDRRTDASGNYHENTHHQNQGSWQHSWSTSRLSGNSGNQQQFGYEFGGQQRVSGAFNEGQLDYDYSQRGHETGFGGQQTIENEFGSEHSIGQNSGNQESWINNQQNFGKGSNRQSTSENNISYHNSASQEFGGQQTMEHSFRSKQTVENGFAGQQTMDHDFDSQHTMDNDFGNGHTLENGFGGQKTMEHSFGSQTVEHGFGGQQTMEHSFGSQTIEHDFGGQQTREHVFGSQKKEQNNVRESEKNVQNEQMTEQLEKQNISSHISTAIKSGDDQRSSNQDSERKTVENVVGEQQSIDAASVDSEQATVTDITFQKLENAENTLDIDDDDLRHREGLESMDVKLLIRKDQENEINEELSENAASNENIFSNIERISDFKGACSTWGFHHYRTFNGGVFTYPSSCEYILSSVCGHNDLIISIRSSCSGESSCLRTVGIQVQENRYELSYNQGLISDGEILIIPTQLEDITVEKIARYIVARLAAVFTVWLNEEGSVVVTASKVLKNRTCGLCGKFSDHFTPKFRQKDGAWTNDIFSFANSWKKEDQNGVCVEKAEPRPPCSADSKDKSLVSDKANLACAAIYNAQFEKCREIVDGDIYYAKCQMDCCSIQSAENCECSSIGEFILECSRSGGDVREGWRQPGLCPMLCSNGTVYNECGPPCAATCTEMEPACEQEKCVDGCHCPEGKVLENGQCIQIDQCPCHHGEEVYEPGDQMQQDCNTCVCQEGKWQCTDSICPSTCYVSGPHITTFDGLGYDLYGRCPHYLVDSDDFSIQLEYGENCKLNEGGVCVRGLTIQTAEGAVVKLKSTMEVSVNGKEIFNLPVQAPGIYVGQATSTYIRARLNNNLEIFWNLESSVQVNAPVQLFDKLRGLCGTFTKNQADDFYTPEGDVEKSSKVFSRKWMLEESCNELLGLTAVENEEKFCDKYPNRRVLAANVCSVIKGSVFEECHKSVDYDRYYSDCMEDVCGCESDYERCSCLSLSNYASACAKKGKTLFWRQSIPSCGISCSFGQMYQSCANPCSYSCSEIAHIHDSCDGSCVEGCVCPPGQTLNEHKRCVPTSTCSCYHSGHLYPPEFLQRRGKEMCECAQGHWDCHEASASDIFLTPAPLTVTHCDVSLHFETTDCMSDCPLTCSNIHHHQPCTVAVCVPGCRCQKGYVLDSSKGACILPQTCPCHHGGQSYDEGQVVRMDCNTCTCEGGLWACDDNTCPGLCSTWGDSHYETFDGNLYDIHGECSYVLVKTHSPQNELFSVVVQNVPCGAKSSATCGKSVSVSLGDVTVTFTRDHPLPEIPENSKLSIGSAGLFTLISTDFGISVQWDRNTRVYVTAQPMWQNKLKGLCGDFNSDSSDDFQPPSGGVPLVLVKDFVDSWRVHKFCRPASKPEDACEKNPERRAWARHKCSVLRSDEFESCHHLVEVEDYYQRCVTDACACSSGGDCECLCAVVSAYAQKCARNGVIISWRSQDLCPIQCEACDHYSPCISLCPPINCDNYLEPPEKHTCSLEPCIEGCETKPCPAGEVYLSATNLTCVPEETCQEKPCIVIDGTPYKEGERIPNGLTGDSCQSCYCRNGDVDCIGVPCTSFSPTPTVAMLLKECQFTGWSEWVNSINPEDNDGNDKESIEKLVSDRRVQCPIDHIRTVECRTALTQEPSEISGQNIICNENFGLMCNSSTTHGDCLDYEMRVYCQCHEEVTCSPGEKWHECAFECDKACQSFITDLKNQGVCSEGQRCIPGCVKEKCVYPTLARDAETCVPADMCTCKLSSGFTLAPGEVVTNGCEKCQCLNNSLICSTTIECKEPEVAPTVSTAYEVRKITPSYVTRTSEKSTTGIITTPAPCAYWSDWINKSRPKKGLKNGDRETTRPHILKQTEGFCLQGRITAIECHDSKTGKDYKETNEEKLVCDLSTGFRCLNRNQPDGKCQDYKIRYFCACGGETTQVPIRIKPTTPLYVHSCTEFVHLIDGIVPVPDVNIKASSSFAPSTGPQAIRIGSDKAWTPMDSDGKQFIEVNLGDIRTVYGVVTKGSEYLKEWVTSYQILYSDDGHTYSYYQDDQDVNKVFSGNFDGSSEVKHVFSKPFETKYVRLEPLSWEEKIALRMDLLGCAEAISSRNESSFEPWSFEEVCTDPMGLENGLILDSQISASSSYSPAFAPDQIKLGSDSIWVAAVADENQYIQVDFIDSQNVSGILTKGREDIPQWVTAFAVGYSNDGLRWSKIMDDDNSILEFSANYDQYSSVTNMFPATIRTRFLRLFPSKWKNWISMKMEILGCYHPEPCRDPMGLENGLVTDHQFSASSENSELSTAANSRFSLDSAWSPEKDDKNSFLQIDLLVPMKLTGIVTRGDANNQQWVKTFFVSYSNDSINWKKVQNTDGRAKEFIANKDDDSPVINTFPIPINSRYVRVLPTDWHRWVSMKVELLGCFQQQNCRDPMGLENGMISNGQITASSALNIEATSEHVRISDQSGWQPDSLDQHPYIQVDFLEPRNVSAVVTKGVKDEDKWVTEYKILYSNDGHQWSPILDDYLEDIIFPGNTDRNSPVVNIFPEDVDARFFRLVPLKFENGPGLRMELLGCYHPYVCQEPLGMENGAIFDFQISASSFLKDTGNPVNARLDSNTAWIPENNDKEPFLKIDLLIPTNVTGVITRGRNDANEWVKVYQISHSLDGLHWENALESTRNISGFYGNVDNESPVSHLLPSPVFARYVRIMPTDYEKKISMRVEILGCYIEKVCMEPMGLESGLLSNSRITASSFKSPNTVPSNLQMNSNSAWSPASTDKGQFVQVDFGGPRNISAVVTKGHPNKDQWVSAYEVAYSNDEDHWITVEDEKGDAIEFTGNIDSSSPIVNVLPHTIEAQYIRIIPKKWENQIALQAEILGCYHPYEPILEPEEVFPVAAIPTEPMMVAPCPNPMEPESSLLKDARLASTSSEPEGDLSRIYLNTRGENGLTGGWVPKVDDLHPVLMVEFPQTVMLTSIYIQGRGDKENWVKTLRVISSPDNYTWLPVFGPNGNELIDGNEDQNSVVGHYFKKPVETKFVKVIPESWHRWPSFRIDLRGCHTLEVSTETLIPKYCPTLFDEPDLMGNCPAECPEGHLCDGKDCVDPLDCPCVHEGKIFKVGDRLEDQECRQCLCALGGQEVCTHKVCPKCAEDELAIYSDNCSCLCQRCKEDEFFCPTNGDCIPIQRRCDGIIDCPNDEVNCPTTSVISTTEVPTTESPIQENATCDILGKHINTFDGQDINYEICHHVIMKHLGQENFNITAHKDCDFVGSCKQWIEIFYKNNKVRVSSDLNTQLDGHSYTASQLRRLKKSRTKRSKLANLSIEKIGEQVVVKALNGDFTVTYDTRGHINIEVPPTLQREIVGLCGFYSGNTADDQQKPNGRKAYTAREFGDSWAVNNSEKDCAPVLCPHEEMKKALELCNQLKEEPFIECGKVLSVSPFIEFCMSTTCECLRNSKNSSGQCKCDSFQAFAEACEAKLGPLSVRNWRLRHECYSECPPGMEWNDCGPSCQLTCERTSLDSLDECSNKCVPGCFCPPGTVLNEDVCIPPTQCADQVCQGFGDPHFKTFDGLFFPFQATGTFLIVSDKENNFVVKGITKRCGFFTVMTCLVGLEVVHKETTVIIRKKKEVRVNNKAISMDKLPFYASDAVILGYPGRTFIVVVPQIGLEVRYYEENSGFAVKVPSKSYFNKTVGLCGNCNGEKEDEIKEEPLEEFVCSWQTEGDKNNCKKSLEELPEIPERIPMCVKLDDVAFEACHPLIDVEVYIDACSFDAVHSTDYKASLCKTAMEYARQCCQAGIDLENWPEKLGCDTKCPDGLQYHQCHKGCPQTCVSVENNSSNSLCNHLKTDGCFCPEGKVLKNGSCVNLSLCRTCDEEGHVPGDSWNGGDCKKCHCRPDLMTECVLEICPANPVCSIQETLVKQTRETEDVSCCEKYTCVPKEKDCPPLDVPKCEKGEIAKVYKGLDLCPKYKCECDQVLCAPLSWPEDLELGQKAEMINDSCCPSVRVDCHADSCPDKPECGNGLELTELEGECCTVYKCKPPKDVCVYTDQYKVVEGFQEPKESLEMETIYYEVGKEWTDGLCETCSCIENKGQLVPLCVKAHCPATEDMPENKEYVLHEYKTPGKCCPDIFRIQCKDEEGNIYEAGEQWSDENDPCITYLCEETGTGDVTKSKSIINCTECPKTAILFPPSKILGQCCGVCKVMKCEDDDILYSVGDTWTSNNHPCRTAECVNEFGKIKTVYTRQPCPAIPKECPRDKIVQDETGCCEICNITSEISCSTGPIPVDDTIGFFTYKDIHRGGICVNEKPVPNVLKCSGACHSSSYYSLEDGEFKDMCQCCKVNVTIERTIELRCPNGNNIFKTFLQPDTCQCSKCAPKETVSTTEKSEFRPSFESNPWVQSVDKGDFHPQKSWEPSDFDFAQKPYDIREKYTQQEAVDTGFGESWPFEQNQIQQQLDDDNY
ncbi:uncharacterized protein LOC129223130 [Uloborus diversus]|uniref:uncharacterized protein LOC129223130 n=1 Tax=Uloborus diversus TaxID=327109 RepID=UPI00240975B8|nr:uncharacterized protein LOC129223130 [Uloborus diversus]